MQPFSLFIKKTVEPHQILCRLNPSETEQHSDEKTFLKLEIFNAEGSQI
jgi:hypothetical protein